MSDLRLGVGVHHGVSEQAYHDDPCEDPSLSCSIAQLLLTRSPAHAAVAHPRLRRSPLPRDETKFLAGTALHELLLGGQGRFRVVDADDWRAKAAKEARDEAIASGLVPILRGKWNEMRLVVEVVRDQMAESPYLRDALDPRHPREATVIWREIGGAVWCRCRPDLLTPEAVLDFKFTGAAATPEVWGGMHAMRLGYPMRAAFYLRGLKAALGQHLAYRFVVIEDAPPYALSVFEATPRVLEMGEEEVEEAIKIWGRCMRTAMWPGYPSDLQWLEPPPSEEYRHEARKSRATFGTHRSIDLALDMQRPSEALI